MPKVIQLPTHIANLIAAGEVVERPASVVKELLENAVDAGASKVTVEIKDGGMTFLRVTDDGCGMSAEDARTAFLRHATSKLHCEDDLAAIGTMGFRGEALAAISSVSRIDLMTKTAGSTFGTSLHLEAGAVTDQSEAGCPEGTTIIIRDLFYNTPARMKFMKSDTVEGGRVASAVQMQALAHPEVSFRFLRDGKEVLSTPGNGGLQAAVYCIYGRDFAKMIPVDSRWENCSLKGYVTKPTDSRPSRSLQTFFVNDRPVKSRLLVTALEEAYRNQIMVGKFPACVLHLTIPPNTVDVNVHPAKTEVKFLSEKNVFDCVHYGVLGTLNKTPDRPNIQFKTSNTTIFAQKPLISEKNPLEAVPQKKENFFRTMTAQEFQTFSQEIVKPVKPDSGAAEKTAVKIEEEYRTVLKEPVKIPEVPDTLPFSVHDGSASELRSPLIPAPEQNIVQEPIQEELPMPEQPPWRLVGELYRSYILVEQGDNAFLIDKHAAHERILFDKLKANPEEISSQMLLAPVSCTLSPECTGELLENKKLLEDLGFEIEEFGENTVLIRRIPMDLTEADAADALDAIGADLLNGRREDQSSVRDNVLHTVACKAAIKAGWHTDEKELLALVGQVMSREDLKYCPHGRPICITLSRKQLEKQFKRT